MAVDPVPFAIAGEVDHSAEIVRQDIYDGTGGAEGISSVGALKVLAQQVPNGTVRVIPGGALLNNRYPGGAGQSYSARNATQSDVNITATGSTGGRTDLVILRILDPQYEGQPPADPQTFQYTRLAVVEGVPAGTQTAEELNLGYPAIELAKITLPANTGTVTQAMITDLRKVAQPRTRSDLRTHSITMGNEDVLNATSAYPDGGETWPEAAENDWQFFDIPKWATRMKVIMHWSGVRSPGGDVWGKAWVQVGYSVNPDHIVTQATSYDTSGTGTPFRMHMMVADEIYIPAALRGGKHKIYPRANVDGGAASQFIKLDAGSSLALQVEFMERAD